MSAQFEATEPENIQPIADPDSELLLSQSVTDPYINFRPSILCNFIVLLYLTIGSTVFSILSSKVPPWLVYPNIFSICVVLGIFFGDGPLRRRLLEDMRKCTQRCLKIFMWAQLEATEPENIQPIANPDSELLLRRQRVSDPYKNIKPSILCNFIVLLYLTIGFTVVSILSSKVPPWLVYPNVFSICVVLGIFFGNGPLRRRLLKDMRRFTRRCSRRIKQE